jgi:uncharacterized membrane protein
MQNGRVIQGKAGSRLGEKFAPSFISSCVCGWSLDCGLCRYSPRLVLWIARDPVISHALGVFTATFLYAIAALAWVDRSGSGRVPLSDTVFVTALLIVSVIMFIFLIQRVGMLQVNRMLIFTADQGREIIENLYPPLDTPPSQASKEIAGSPCIQTLLHHGPPAIIQAVDIPALVDTGTRNGSAIELPSPWATLLWKVRRY